MELGRWRDCQLIVGCLVQVGAEVVLAQCASCRRVLANLREKAEQAVAAEFSGRLDSSALDQLWTKVGG